jgi:hypothetical protein
MSYFSGSLGISYAVAMGLRVLAIVAPNDKVRFADANVHDFSETTDVSSKIKYGLQWFYQLNDSE